MDNLWWVDTRPGSLLFKGWVIKWNWRKLYANEHLNEKSCQHTIKRSISAQIDTAYTQDPKVATPAKVITPPPHKSAIKAACHYYFYLEYHFCVYSISASSLCKKIGTTGIIRCFPVLTNEDRPYADFKIILKNKNHLDLLKDITMWYNITLSPPVL